MEDYIINISYFFIKLLTATVLKTPPPSDGRKESLARLIWFQLRP